MYSLVGYCKDIYDLHVCRQLISDILFILISQIVLDVQISYSYLDRLDEKSFFFTKILS